MKRLICVLLIACCLSVTFAACSSEETNVSSVPSMNTLDTSFDMGDRTTEDKDLTAKGYPPLPLDQQILWQDANEMLGNFALCRFNTAGVTREINGMTYNVIVDERYPDYDGLVTYLQRFFTDDFIYSDLLTANGPVKSSSDHLACVVQASGADDATYAGHVFTVDSITAKQIDMTATVYSVKSGVAGTPFYKTPKNANDYNTTETKFTMVMTDKGWRFSQCSYLKLS